MSHTVILDEAERDRRMVNHLNEILRHCRIGRVMPKARKAFPLMVLPKSWMPDPMKPAPTQSFSGGYVPVTSSGDVPLVPSHGVLM